MSRKKKMPRLIMLYDLSEGDVKVIPFRVADYTERRNKKKNSQLQKESNNPVKDKSNLPLKEPDPNPHVANLLPGPQEILDGINEIFSSDVADFEKELFFDNSQPSDYLFIDDESFYNY